MKFSFRSMLSAVTAAALSFSALPLSGISSINIVSYAGETLG